MNKFTNDDWLENSNRRLKKKKRKLPNIIATITTIILVVPFTLLFVVLFLSSNNDIEQNDRYTPQKHIALLNSKEAIVWKEENGEFSARIQYEFCEPLSFIDDCRWDKSIIEVKWSK